MNRSLAMLGVAAALLSAVVAPAAADTFGPTSLVDRPTGFGALPFDGVNNASIGVHSLSADGRFVVFESGSDVLLDGDDDTSLSIYRLDRRDGTLAQVNTTAAGGQPSLRSTSFQSSISADGRYVEFTSSATNLVPSAPSVGIYVKDMQTGAVELASRATGANGAAVTQLRTATLSGDGRHVVFVASGTVDGDNADGVPAGTDVYVRSLDAGTTHMVSVTANGAEAGGATAARADIDFRGDAVAYLTTARLDPDDPFADDDVYARTGIGGGTEGTRFVSFTTGQTGGADRAGPDVSISGDGGLVAWSNGFGTPYMTRLVPSVAPATAIAKPRPGGSGSSGDQPTFEPVPDGTTSPKRVTLRAFGPLDPADTNQTADLYGVEVAHPGDGNFVHLETSGTVDAPVSTGAAAVDGSAVVFGATATALPGGDGVRAQVYLHTGSSDRNISQPDPPRTSAAGPAGIDRRAMSDDGRVVAFAASAPVFGSPIASNGFAGEVLVRDVTGGQTTLASIGTDGKPADQSSGRVSIDAAGDRVVFLSQASNLVPGIAVNGRSHVYLRDLSTGTTTLVDRTAAGAPLTSGAFEGRISADGRHVVYTSSSADAPGQPANDRSEHVYVVDLGTGTTVLADRADGAAGAIADKDSFRVDIDADGSRVAFVNTGTNLGAGDPGGQKRQAYVRDLDAKTTTWISIPEDANPTHANADEPILSRDGTRVAFDQSDPLFGNGMSGLSQIFIRDLVAGTTQLVSRDTGLADPQAFGPSTSGDGTRVTFFARPAATPAIGQVYERDLAAGTTTLVSTRRDGSGPARLGASQSALSGNGACVAFGSTSDDIVSPSYGPDFGHVFERCAAPAGGGGGDGGGGDGGGGGGGSTNGGGGTGKPGDRTAPVISKASLSNRRFVVASGRTALVARTPRGTRFGFKLSEKASTTIAITQRLAGRRSGKRCVAPRKGLTRKCTRIVTVITLIRAGTRAGTNRVAFTGRTAKRTLKPGTYEAQLTARDPAGNRSRAVKLGFRVVK